MIFSGVISSQFFYIFFLKYNPKKSRVYLLSQTKFNNIAPLNVCLFFHFKSVFEKNIIYLFFSLLQINIFWCFQIILMC